MKGLQGAIYEKINPTLHIEILTTYASLKGFSVMLLY